jgi:hypothetical protein
MPSPEVRCVLVIIHGIGNQQPDWHGRFDAMLGARLAELTDSQRARFAARAVYWADLSNGPGIGGTAGFATGHTLPADVQFSLVQQAYAQHLTGGDAAGAPAAFGLPLPNPKKVVAVLKDGHDTVVEAIDGATDVANYVSNNGIRAQIQFRLSDALLATHEEYPNATVILGSHSQGTIVSYDVLRLVSVHLPWLTTWVTMGSPLDWYLNSLRWGHEAAGLAPALTWINLYDRHDVVGTTVKGRIKPPAPAPEDIDVDNVGNHLDAHDHWHNPVVVDHYFQLIKPLVM